MRGSTATAGGARFAGLPDPGASSWSERLLTWANAAAFWGYAVFLVGPAGILGLFVPRWLPMDFEVYARAVFTAPLLAEDLASALNQYRFMKTTEFGFGLFAMLFRDDVFRDRRVNAFFLGIVFLGAGIRVLSLVLDGRPHSAYVFFIGLESTLGGIMLLQSRRTLAGATAHTRLTVGERLG